MESINDIIEVEMYRKTPINRLPDIDIHVSGAKLELLISQFSSEELSELGSLRIPDNSPLNTRIFAVDVLEYLLRLAKVARGYHFRKADEIIRDKIWNMVQGKSDDGISGDMKDVVDEVVYLVKLARGIQDR